MHRFVLRSKIHRATVTKADLHYEGSITLPASLIKAANMAVYEQVDVLNIHNGARFTTYIIEGEGDSHDIQINGAAARLAQPGDLVIICAYGMIAQDALAGFSPTIVQMTEGNQIVSIHHGGKA